MFHESVFPLVKNLSSRIVPLSVPEVPPAVISTTNTNSIPSLAHNSTQNNISNNICDDVSNQNDSNNHFDDTMVQIRRSSRITKIPSYLSDYVHPYTSNT